MPQLNEIYKLRVNETTNSVMNTKIRSAKNYESIYQSVYLIWEQVPQKNRGMKELR